MEAWTSLCSTLTLAGTAGTHFPPRGWNPRTMHYTTPR